MRIALHVARILACAFVAWILIAVLYLKEPPRIWIIAMPIVLLLGANLVDGAVSGRLPVPHHQGEAVRPSKDYQAGMAMYAVALAIIILGVTLATLGGH